MLSHSPATVRAVAVSIVVSLGALTTASAVLINVPNASFEGPAISPTENQIGASPSINNWSEEPVPASPNDPQDPQAFLTGVFVNPAPGQPGRLQNADGSQLGFMFNAAGVSLFQTLGATYTPGSSYSLTLALETSSNQPVTPGGIFGIRLYYVVAGARLTAAETQVTYSAAFFGAPADPQSVFFGDPFVLNDFTTTLPTVQAGDPWAGLPIGVEVRVLSSGATQGGVWDVENVRLNTPAVPEPSGALLLAGGALSLLRRRGRVTVAA